MRALLAGIFALGLTALAVTARTSQAGDGADRNVAVKAKTDSPALKTNENHASRIDALQKPEASSLVREHQQLRDLLVSQAEELKQTREQLRQLQQRMKLLEMQLQAQSNSSASKEVAVTQAVPAALRQGPEPSTATIGVLGVSHPENGNSYLSAKPDASKASSATPILPSAISIPPGNNRADARQTGQERTSESIQLANGKVRIGTLLYADYAYYPKSGFGPQFTSQINPPGPANNGYNTFEITRAYINLFYSPTDAVTFRLTPDLYRQIGAAPGTKIGKVSAIGPNTDQGLPFRLKYAYVDFNTLFASSDAFKKDKLTIGQQQDPVIGWEERLYGYRYANIVPWDYLGYSSSWAGISLHGPIEFDNKMYLDYSIGVYDNASYRLLEQSEKKQAAARLTVYPFGARSNYDGLGFTGFYDFAYTNVTPDSGVNIPLYRVSLLAHYTFKKNAYAIAGEFEAGRNAFSSGNFFSGSAPLDEYGLGTTQYAGFDALVKALQNGNGTKQRGYAVFGHAQVPRSPFTLFAMYHSFSPNVRVAKNPIDFERIVAGIGYKVNDRLSFAVSSQNVLFRHSQFTFPATELQLLSPSLAAANPNGITNAVPNRVQAIFVSTGFNF
jgi:TolA-binding protein